MWWLVENNKGTKGSGLAYLGSCCGWDSAGVTQPQSRGCSQGTQPKQTGENLCGNLGERMSVDSAAEFEKAFLILKAPNPGAFFAPCTSMLNS